MKILFIDESGIYNSDINKLDPNNPVFLICGVIIDPKWRNILQKDFIKLKNKYFEYSEIVFHSREFANPTKSKQRHIDRLKDPEFRGRFYIDLNKILEKIEFQITGFVVHVPEYLKALVANQPDPYLIGIETVFDSYVKSLKPNEKGHIIAEDRSSPKLNKAVLDRWRLGKKDHNRIGLTANSKIDEHEISEPEFRPKNPLETGLELVDLVAYHFARALGDKTPKGPKNEITLSLINSKMHPDGYFALPAHPQYYLNKSAAQESNQE